MLMTIKKKIVLEKKKPFFRNNIIPAFVNRPSFRDWQFKIESFLYS